ncbi:MAG: thiopurine S-methyltransferase [Alcanivoracaceae bacterium]|nr:thiopurine S-methyltransferase [Alcanivoracaceae bacterium]
MEISFWHERWEKGEIGFHLTKVNPLLTRWWQALDASAGTPVWVPLCGKSLDMTWLHQQGHPVTAVELSRQALQAFDAEQGLDLRWRQAGPLEAAEGPGLTLYCGDYFSVTGAQLTHIGLVYDRAALVALPAPMRQRYVAHMRAVLPAGWRMLLLTFDYPQEQRAGPPFSVTDDEVRQLFRGCTIDVLSEQQVIDRHPGFREQGLTSMIERAYRICHQPL